MSRAADSTVAVCSNTFQRTSARALQKAWWDAKLAAMCERTSSSFHPCSCTTFRTTVKTSSTVTTTLPLFVVAFVVVASVFDTRGWFRFFLFRFFLRRRRRASFSRSFLARTVRSMHANKSKWLVVVAVLLLLLAGPTKSVSLLLVILLLLWEGGWFGMSRRHRKMVCTKVRRFDHSTGFRSVSRRIGAKPPRCFFADSITYCSASVYGVSVR